MTSNELKKKLHGVNIGKKMFGTGNLVFDKQVSVVSSGDLKKALAWAKAQLAWWVYSPRADCNKYHLMLCGRINEWFLLNTSKELPIAVGMVYGYFNGENHFWCYAITENGVVHINYGELETPDNYMGAGSLTP